MQAFGITFDKYSIPIIYLACSVVGFLLMRESIHMFQHPIAARAISVILEIGFILLAIPATYSLKVINIPKKAVILIAFWLVWTLTSTLLGTQPWAAIVRWLELLISITTAFCLYILISQKPQLLPLIVKAIIAAVLLCILAFAIYWNISPYPIQHDWASDIPLFMNIRHFGYLAAVAVPLGYWLLEINTIKNHSIFWIFVYLTLCWALVFWLGGRGTFLAVSITTVLYLSISKEKLKWILLSIVLGLFTSQLFIVDHPSLNLFRLWREDVSLNALTSFRMTIYIDSVIYWWQHSAVMGVGADGFRYIIPAIGELESIAHPHSIIIQLLLSYGILGLLIPSYFFFLLSWKAAQSNQKQTKVFYLVFLSTMILSIFDGILYHAYGLFISTIIAGISIAYIWPFSPCSELPVTNKSYKIKSIPLILTAVTLFCSAYYLIFSIQLYHSKYDKSDEQWANWSAEYPIYFSPTWTYLRYKTEDIEYLKTLYSK